MFEPRYMFNPGPLRRQKDTLQSFSWTVSKCRESLERIVLKFEHINIMKVLHSSAGPPRGGGKLPRTPRNYLSPRNFLLGPEPQSFFWVKYFRAKGKIFVFLGKVPKFGMKNWGGPGGGRWLSEKKFSGKNVEIGAPKKICPEPPPSSGWPCSSGSDYCELISSASMNNQNKEVLFKARKNFAFLAKMKTNRFENLFF
jgi:hypothetical protein